MPAPRLASIAIAMLVLLAACGGGGAAADVTPPPDADLTIDARDLRFDHAELEATSGADTRLFFRNLDGVPHNFSIYADSSASDPLFTGDAITDGSILYQLPALEAGSYYFRCDIHPDMHGTFDVN